MSSATICIVDDNEANRDLLEQELADAGYRVITAGSGHAGLDTVLRERPDLLLLDIMMPDLSGYEVCRILRRTDATTALPIILVTAKTGTRDEVIGLDSGANDYVTKPINIETLLARVRTQLRIKTLQDELRRNYESFMRLDRARQEMISMLTHDLKTPLMAVSASTKLLLEPETARDENRLNRVASLLLKSTQKMHELVEDFLHLARWDQTGLVLEIEVCQLQEIIQDTLDVFSHHIRDRALDVRVDLPAEPVFVYADKALLSRVWQNLLSNAVKYNRDGGSVTLEVHLRGDSHVVCVIEDTGIGIPAEVLPRVYDAFYRPTGRKEIEGTGLGLAVVRAILRAHKSGHRIISTEGEGTHFEFALPRAPAEDATPPAVEALAESPLVTGSSSATVAN